MVDKFSRQVGIVPSKVMKMNFLVCGAGAIGRNVALNLAHIGCKKITVYDFDTVEIHNVCSQGYLIEDVGGLKVKALNNHLLKINPDINFMPYSTKWRPDFEFYDYVFLCVDCMEARAHISKYYMSRKVGKQPVIIDTRMKGEEFRILCINDLKTYKEYTNSLFSNAEAADGNCTSQSTYYCSNIVAGLAVQRMVAHSRNGNYPSDSFGNLFAFCFGSN